MRFWFFPIWSGDIRLERASDETCVMTVEDPTESDRDLLKPFLPTAKEMGWLDKVPTISLIGKTIVPLKGTISEIGPILAGEVHQDASLWTGLRHSDGRVTLSDGTVLRSPKAPEPAAPSTALATTAVAAVTVREPKRGCPPPEAATRRASEVLRTFCTERQWKQWQRDGAMTVIGHATGKAYHLFHRDEAARRRLGHVLVEVGTGREVCVWDSRVPAEEEALAVKFAVEHRESWMLSLGLGVPRLKIGGGGMPRRVNRNGRLYEA